ncbi:long-chain fatty acid--CoA ligase [cyanobacterium TDX16]|nr:long-chain fatty acid--CoA ligase [cyanobacterium TDX16]
MKLARSAVCKAIYCGITLNRGIDYASVQSLPEIWSIAQQQFSQIIALKDPHAQPEVSLTYAQMYRQTQQFAAGLQALGIQRGDRVALFADNSPRWAIADRGIITAGAVDAVRSAQAGREELLFILADSGSTALVVEDRRTLIKLRDRLGSLPIKLVILLSDEVPEAGETFKVMNFPTLIAIGTDQPLQPIVQNRDTLATLIYTSGTSGKPKGVMLSHGNLIHQIVTLGTVFGAAQPQPCDRFLSILPSWHVYERTCEYFLFSQGCTQIYTNIRYFKQDLKEFRPHITIGVPRLWESIYVGVQKQKGEQPANKQKQIDFLLASSQRYIEARRVVRGLTLEPQPPNLLQRLIAGIRTIGLLPLHALGDRLIYRKVRESTGGLLKLVVSGDGSLAQYLDDFFEIVGIEILVGYGLTETSPVTNVRCPWHNLRSSSGQPIPGTEIRIVDPETRQPLAVGQRGLVLVRGPQIMQGYYQNPAMTARVIDWQGWFDTGDLGWVTSKNDLVVTGRAKDTIVLTNGENIEPQPIEDACLRSPYIDQIMLVGQDRRSLGALIVPNLEALQQYLVSRKLHLLEVGQGRQEGTPDSQIPKIDFNDQQIQHLFRQELNREVQNRPGYRADDRIGSYMLVLEPFSMENGMLTQTLKIRRAVVMERYHEIVNEMFA